MEPGQRVAIITGGSFGVGSALVAAYRELGWAVVANAARIATSDDPHVAVVEGDIADPATTARIVDEASRRFGRVDTLINNAAIYPSKPFTEYTYDDYLATIGVNLTGFFTLTQSALAGMLKVGGGHIVNFTVTLAEYAMEEEPATLVSLTKGGITAVTKSLAIEYASRGVRVNAVSTSVVETPEYEPKSYGVTHTPMYGRVNYAAAAARHPLRRLARISDIVDGVMFLESSPFITGEILHIDGGRSAGH
jgi:NAD(P)-dependent dehydrogenase (short-subunit alcohol dehydrogenase family)